MKRLAIITPAYKENFLFETLQSLANQTNKDFNVYVGDDCSPYDLQSIVSRFEDRLDIHYVRFSENLGRTNLVAHWNRCIKLLKEEDYFCFFSDDDLMESRCVEKFYEVIDSGIREDVYHFDIDIINEDGKLIKECPSYPKHISSIDFFSLLYSYQIEARMPEFIFKTKNFYECGGFVEFDLAFRSDNATVMSCSQSKGIYTISGSKVLWRDSGQNISSVKYERLDIKYRKMKATLAFHNWLDSFFKKKHQSFPFSLSRRRKLVLGEIISLYPEYSFGKLSIVLLSFNKLKANPFLFLYYWIDFVFLVCKWRKRSKGKRMS